MIRKITNKDLTKIYALGKKYDSNFAAKYNLEAYLDNDIYILNCYEEENLLKGFIICTNLSQAVEVLLVYVDEAYRKNKIGEKLMRSIEDDASEIILEVSVLNTPAINLYEKLKFVKISERPRYYDGIDALVMKKVLK